MSLIVYLDGFKGLLICSRGRYAEFYKSYFHEELKARVENYLGEVLEERFEGALEVPEYSEVYYLYVLFLAKELLRGASFH